MYVISAIPLTFVPRQEAQVFTYFFSEPLERGQIAIAPIGAREAKMLVLGSEDVAGKKTELRTAPFKLKGITEVFNEHRVVNDDDLAFFEWIAEYYFSPVGFVARVALPAYLLSRPDLMYESPVPQKGAGFSLSYSQSPLRFAEYIKTAKKNEGHDRQTLILFPEVLSAERFFERVPAALKETAVLLTQQRTPRQEYELRTRMLNNDLKTVIGTRSAVLLSLPWLSTIIVEGEENDALKSWDAHPRYDARSASVWRARRHGLELVLGSDVLSVATYKRVRDEGGTAPLRERDKGGPATHIIDMREELKAGNASRLSRRLQEELSYLREGRQGILLINRRGEYSVTLCRDCGHVLRCDRCDSALVTLRNAHEMLCRYCGRKHTAPDQCPECAGHHFRTFGAGTQRVAEELTDHLPKLKVARLDSDSTASIGAQRAVIDRFNRGEYDVLVGTQMVVRPRVVRGVHLAAVVSLEASLLLPEYNGEEQAYLLAKKLHMMAEDTFIWQTYRPEHGIFSYFNAPSGEQFFKEALVRREKFRWPPYAQLVILTLRMKDLERARERAQAVRRKLEKVRIGGITVYDPLPAHVARVRGQYVWEILLKVESSVLLKERNAFLSHVPSQWEVDVDPVSTLN